MRTLLIVDDVQTNREILKRMLESEYTILEAENGKEALQLIHRNYKSLSAVLLDLLMPVMDGYEVLEQMQHNAMLSAIPVIVTTGSTAEEAEVRALALGANDFITKPYNPVVIRHRLRNTIKLRETAAIINVIQRDKLTGLFNRETFFAKVTEIVNTHMAGFYVMACVDINHFKIINDQYGSAKGDEVLKHVAQCLQSWTSSVGGLCCRITADTFALFYPSSQEPESLEAIHAEIAAPPCIDSTLGIRIGRYVVGDLSLSISAMYDRAALAVASIIGRYVFRPND